MKLAFCLFKYFPYGGLQRDFYRIATLAADRGHEVHVYTMSWEGEIDPRFKRHLFKVRGLTNHTRIKHFITKVEEALSKEIYDVVIGFNKMPHLDVYYAADVCYVERIEKTRPGFYKLFPRYRFYKDMEAHVFSKNSHTKIMVLSLTQQAAYIKHYHTAPSRFHLLPPGISKELLHIENTLEIKKNHREQYHLSMNEKLILMVGSGFKTKGVDRGLLAFASLPEEIKNKAYLWIIGQGNEKSFLRLAKKLRIDNRIRFLGARDDVPKWLLAADLLLHPSYHENTGTVLLEAMVMGLPVLTLDTCGYAHFISDTNSGKVLPSPFSQTKLNEALLDMLQSPNSEMWRNNGIAFSKTADIYNMPNVAMDLIAQGKRS